MTVCSSVSPPSAKNPINQVLWLMFAAAGKLPFSYKHSKSSVVADFRRGGEASVQLQTLEIRNCG